MPPVGGAEDMVDVIGNFVESFSFKDSANGTRNSLRWLIQGSATRNRKPHEPTPECPTQTDIATLEAVTGQRPTIWLNVKMSQACAQIPP